MKDLTIAGLIIALILTMFGDMVLAYIMLSLVILFWLYGGAYIYYRNRKQKKEQAKKNIERQELFNHLKNINPYYEA